MPYSAPKTLNDIIEMIATLSDRVTTSRGKSSIAALPLADGRQVGLRGMHEILAGFAITFGAIRHDRTPAQTDDAFLDVMPQDSGALIDATAAKAFAEAVWRWRLLTMLHFKLDSTFHDVLKAMNKLPGKTGFYANAKALTDNVSITNKRNALDTLMTSAYMRNVFHNNGTHKNQHTLSITLDALFYDFQIGGKPQCLTWEHVCTAIEKALDVVDEILATPEVARLSSV
jgi:hypothetical protein